MFKICKRLSTEQQKNSGMIPLNPSYNPKLRNSEQYDVKFAHNNILRDSAIPALQRMLNGKQ